METVAVIMASIAIFMLEFIAYFFVLSIVQMIVGGCLGYTITSFSFAGFMVRNDNGKISFTIAPTRLIAQAMLIKKNLTVKIKIVFETSVYILITVISSLSLLGFYKMSIDNPYLKYADELLIAIWVIHTLLFVSFLSKVFSKGHEHYLWEQEMIVFNKIKNGVRPRDIQLIDVDLSENSVYAKKCILFNYYILLDCKKYDELQSYINKFEKIIGTVDNIIAQNIPYAYEIIYFYSVINPNLVKAEHYAALLENVLIDDKDMNGRRVYAAYLLGTNKSKDEILSVINQGNAQEVRFSEQVMSGMENELLYELKERLYEM